MTFWRSNKYENAHDPNRVRLFIMKLKGHASLWWYDAEERDPKVRLILYLSDKGSARVKVSCYDGNLIVVVIIYWIGELERYFEYENVHDPNRVRLFIMKLKGHASLWWYML